jgi:hypothetical protein
MVSGRGDGVLYSVTKTSRGKERGLKAYAGPVGKERGRLLPITTPENRTAIGCLVRLSAMRTCLLQWLQEWGLRARRRSQDRLQWKSSHQVNVNTVILIECEERCSKVRVLLILRRSHCPVIMFGI